MIDLTDTVQLMYDHFSHFGLQMLAGTRGKDLNTKWNFSASLKEAEVLKDPPKAFSINDGQDLAKFTNEFKYLGSIIKTHLTEDSKSWSKN